MKTKTFLLSTLVSLSFLAVPNAIAQDEDAQMAMALQQIDDALPGNLLNNPLSLQWEKRGNDMKTKVVDAAALSSGQAVSVRVKKKQTRPWDSVIYTEIEKGVQKGEKVEAHFWVRTDKPATGKDTATISLFVGRNEEPYDYIFSEDVTPGSEWKLMTLSGIAEADFPAGELKAEFQLGSSKQTVEFGAIYVSTLGPAGTN